VPRNYFSFRRSKRSFEKRGPKHSLGTRTRKDEETVMELTRPQRRMLRFYREHRDKPPTIGGFVRHGARVLVVWGGWAAAVGIYFSSVRESPALAYLFVGMFTGAALREFRGYVYTVQVWPALAAIVDWQRVEELARFADGEPRR